MEKKIKVPVKSDNEWKTKEVNFEDLVSSYKKSVNQIPLIVSKLKEADSQKWNELFNELTLYVQNDENLSKVIRTENGVLRIGEPNWAVELVTVAFMVGYSIGSACYRAGHCQFVE